MRPELRRRRRIEIEEAAELAHPMLFEIALAGDAALARPEQVGQRGAAQIHHEIPAPDCHLAVERQPVAAVALLVHDDETLETGNRLEERRRDRARGNGDAGAGMALDQI